MDRALDVPATHAALRRHRRRSLAMLLGAIVLFFATGALLGAAGEPDEGVAATLAFGTMLAMVGLLGFGAFGLAATMTMRRALRRHPWRLYGCRFRELHSGLTPNGTPVLILDGEHTVTITSTAWRWRALDACDGGEVWFAGDPRSHGVASPPGGSHLLAARAPRWRRRRERLCRMVLEEPAPGSGATTTTRP
jgi:hypothetical protein